MTQKPDRGAKQIMTMIVLVSVVAALMIVLAVARSAPEEAPAEPEIDRSALALRASEEMAMQRLAEGLRAELRSADASPRRAALLLEGDLNEMDARALAARIKAAGFPITFYVPCDAPQQYAQTLQALGREGVPMGLSAGSGLEGAAEQTLIKRLCAAAYEVEELSGEQPKSLLWLGEAPSEALLSAAGACYLTDVAMPTAEADAGTLETPEDAAALVRSLKRGSLLRLRLSGTQAVSGAGWVLDALTESDLALRAARLLSENGGALADALPRVYTSEEAAAFTFSDLSREPEVRAALDALDELGAKGTFFVTAEEMSAQGPLVREIAARGHELGLSVNTAHTADAASTLLALLEARETLAEDFGRENAMLVRQAYGTVTDRLREAVSAGGFTLLSSTISAVRRADQYAQTADAVLQSLFGGRTAKLQRGMIVHFELGQYLQSDTLAAEVALKLQRDWNLYALRPVGSLLANEGFTYSFPLTQADILPQLYNRIRAGQLTGSALQAIQRRYIGATWVNNTDTLPGFTEEEIATLDRTGLAPNDNNEMFLSFDDWGTDENLDRLLAVLKKHGVKATFFIRTNYVDSNPNLLRAIAMEGHAIGSHTHSHYTLSEALVRPGQDTIYYTITQEEAAQLSADLVKSYQVMQEIIGDVVVDGRPSLTLLFRQPTLAVSKLGLTQVMDCGFTWAVGGYSTQDYAASSARELADTLQRVACSGRVYVMHMSDNSVYTAEAVDLFLTENEKRPAGKRYTFGRLDDVLSPS
ncbi:MAG: polysaccharide deacetylase family protein [Eubacteriales bacterium]|nr:polysaccharide deacetylase family protein [Eubacteriales bacterium]